MDIILNSIAFLSLNRATPPSLSTVISQIFTICLWYHKAVFKVNCVFVRLLEIAQIDYGKIIRILTTLFYLSSFLSGSAVQSVIHHGPRGLRPRVALHRRRRGHVHPGLRRLYRSTQREHFAAQICKPAHDSLSADTVFNHFTPLRSALHTRAEAVSAAGVTGLEWLTRTKCYGRLHATNVLTYH